MQYGAISMRPGSPVSEIALIRSEECKKPQELSSIGEALRNSTLKRASVGGGLSVAHVLLIFAVPMSHASQTEEKTTMETYSYDARFLCLRIDPSGRQRAAIQAGQQAAQEQRLSLSKPVTFHEHQWKTGTRTPPIRLAPPRYKLAVITWLAIFPLITIVLALFGSLLMQPPLVMRTFVLTVTLVPVMTYLIVPLYMRLFAGWLNRSAPDSRVLTHEIYQDATRRGLVMNVSIGERRRPVSPCPHG